MNLLLIRFPQSIGPMRPHSLRRLLCCRRSTCIKHEKSASGSAHSARGQLTRENPPIPKDAAGVGAQPAGTIMDRPQIRNLQSVRPLQMRPGGDFRSFCIVNFASSYINCIARVCAFNK
jgi:hypothetical protein